MDLSKNARMSIHNNFLINEFEGHFILLLVQNKATENVGVENAIRSKMQWWKMRKWEMPEQTAGWKMQT